MRGVRGENVRGERGERGVSVRDEGSMRGEGGGVKK